MSIVLFSHHGCPYVQRVAIVLAEKGVPHTRRDVDFKTKPPDFLAASPLGQVPAMQVDGASFFDSIAICEYLEERFEPKLHPPDAAQRAHHRAWMAFGSALLQAVGAFFKTPEQELLATHRRTIEAMLRRLETELTGSVYFAGESFSLVDAVFAPVFRYFDAFTVMQQPDFFEGLVRVSAWREQLRRRPSVAQAVQPDFLPKLVDYLSTRPSALAQQTARLRGNSIQSRRQ
jgi:glutathione S-transferase